MTMDRLDQIIGLLNEALEQIVETKRDPEPASTPVLRARALAREMHEELNPAYPRTPAPWAPGS